MTVSALCFHKHRLRSDLLLSQKILYVTDELRGDDGLSPEHPQPFQKHGKADDGAQDDGVHEHTPLDDEINHARLSWSSVFKCWLTSSIKKSESQGGLES